MGIKDYHVWIKSKFPTALIETCKNNIYDYIYIDMNYILHISIYGCSTINEFVKKIYFNLDIIFLNFIATKQVFFALDGTSSFAKVILQRERRSKPGSTNLNHISSLGLSPGTKMMKLIEKKILLYIEILKTQYKYLSPEFKFSPSSISDEGEIKICRQIVNNGKDNLAYTHLIIGNDADIIVLSMGIKPIFNINILISENGNRELVSLKHLLGLFGTSLNTSNDMYVLANNNLRDDFVIISLMMGNDYFPKLAYVNYMKLWDCYDIFYKQYRDTITCNGKFNVDNFKKFMNIVYSNIAEGYKTVNINTYNKSRVRSYLEGLIWCLNIYNTGKCLNYEYAYTGDKPVHPYELYFHLFSEDILEDVLPNGKFSLPISAYIYPLLIMPLSAKNLIPEKYHTIVDTELKYLYDMENCVECKKLQSSYKLTKTKVDTCKNDKLVDKYAVIYREQFAAYNTHKKTHKRTFGSSDIKNIIKLCEEIK